MKSLLLLGGTSDIGIAIAREFANRKFEIFLAGRDEEYLGRIEKDISIRGNVPVHSCLFDAMKFDSHKNFYDSLNRRPDVCICVFGYLGDQRLAENSWQEAEKIIDVNYKGAVSILTVVAEDFSKAGVGTIIGISSVAGDRGRQSNYLYGSAKAGFTAFLSGLRNRLYHNGVHVITVKPGFVETKMTEALTLPPKLTARPEQVAAAVYNAYRKKRNVIYVRPMWRYIMFVIRNVPEFLFKKLKL